MIGRRLVVLLLAVLMAYGIGGCAGRPETRVSPAVVRYFKGLPRGVSVPPEDQRTEHPKPWAARAGQRTIYVMTWGSGSCPKLPSAVTATAPDRLIILTHMLTSGRRAICTADLAVTTSLVRLPAEIDASRALVVRVDGAPTRLAAR